MLSSVDLPQPDEPDEAHELPVGDLEVHVVDGAHASRASVRNSFTRSVTTSFGGRDAAVHRRRRRGDASRRRHDRAHGDTRLRSQRRHEVARDADHGEHDEDREDLVDQSLPRRSTVSRYPRPSVPASSSATTSISHAAARLMRATSMMPGKRVRQDHPAQHARRARRPACTR